MTRPAASRKQETSPRVARRPRARGDGSELVVQRVRAVLDSIPRGRVATYGQVAAEAHLPRRARLVARVLRELPPGSRLPWHRVVAAPGRIAGHPAAPLQARKLRAEGVAVSATGRVDLARYGWSSG
jgi:methylated-DNA-protein-cysteine methyltransferase related protein